MSESQNKRKFSVPLWGLSGLMGVVAVWQGWGIWSHDKLAPILLGTGWVLAGVTHTVSGRDQKVIRGLAIASAVAALVLFYISLHAIR